jgi:hypothetical protein
VIFLCEIHCDAEENRQVSSGRIQAGFAHFRAFEHIEPILGLDVIFQNYSLVENDTESLTPDYAMTGWHHSESSTGMFEDKAEYASTRICVITVATWDVSIQAFFKGIY